MNNKYKEMKKKYNKLQLELIKKVPQLISSTFKAAKNKEDKDLFMVKTVDKLCPMAFEISHLMYENIKDIDKMGSEELYESLQSTKIKDVQSFMLNYLKKRKSIIMGMYLESFCKEHNLEYGINLEFFKRISNDMDPKDAFIVIPDEFLDEYNNNIELLTKNCFSVYELPDNIFQMIEKYHNEYMQENIYSNIVSEEYTENQMVEFSSMAFKR